MSVPVGCALILKATQPSSTVKKPLAMARLPRTCCNSRLESEFKAKRISEAGTVRPQADLTLTYNIGNLKNTTKVSGVSIGEMDSMTNEFAGRFASKVQAGFQVERGNATAGLQFGLTKGSAGKLDTGIKLEGRYRF